MPKYVFYQDGSSDDWAALAILAAQVKLSAVVVAGTGEVRPKVGIKNSETICKLFGLNNVIYGEGSEQRFDPKYGQNFPPFIRDFIDKLLEAIGIKGITKDVPSVSAVEAFHKVISESEEPVVIVSTGPLTDLALLFEKYPEDKKKVEIVMMGGAVNVKGNIQDLDRNIPNEVGEWNLFADPGAASFVISSGVKLTMVPLDVTNHIRLTKEFYDKMQTMAGQKPDSALAIIYHMIRVLKETFEKQNPDISFFDVFYLWDPFAAMVACEPHLAKIEEKYIEVDLITAQTKAVSEPGKGVGRIKVATDIAISAEKILDRFLEIINKLPSIKKQVLQDSQVIKTTQVNPNTLFGKPVCAIGNGVSLDSIFGPMQ